MMSSHLLGSRSRHVDTMPLTSVMTWDGGTRDVCSSQDPYPHRTRCPPSRIRPNPAQTGPATTPRAACKHTPAYRFALEAARCSSECASILATPQTAGRAAVAARGTGPPPAPDPTSHRRKPGATGHISSTATAPGGGGRRARRDRPCHPYCHQSNASTHLWQRHPALQRPLHATLDHALHLGGLGR